MAVQKRINANVWYENVHILYIYIYIYLCLEQLAQTEANIFACRTHSHIKLHYASHDTFDKRIQTSAVQISQSQARLAKNEIIFNFPFVLVFQAACSQSCRQLLFDIMHYCMHYGIRQKNIYERTRTPTHTHTYILVWIFQFVSTEYANTRLMHFSYIHIAFV